MGRSKLVRGFVTLGLATLAVGLLAAPAVAQARPAATPGACTFTEIRPPSIQAGTDPILVDIEGKAPAGSTVRAFVSGAQVADTVATDGTFSFKQIRVPTADTPVTVNYDTGQGNAYTSGCQGGIVDPGITVSGASISRGLAFTGSSNTFTNVLIALGAVALGAVLVVATRRRTRVEA